MHPFSVTKKASINYEISMHFTSLGVIQCLTGIFLVTHITCGFYHEMVIILDNLKSVQ